MTTVYKMFYTSLIHSKKYKGDAFIHPISYTTWHEEIRNIYLSEMEIEAEYNYGFLTDGEEKEEV